jgi:myosin-5
MDKVLQSNPILEAFGNARTIRNDNSSRFGKFIEMHFNKRAALIGASIRTYLLEKVRLPTHAENERNFHIFYQMCSGASDEERIRWRLRPLQDYHYTNQGECYTLRHVRDEDEWPATRQAMRTLNFSENDTEALLSCTAGLLQLGQVRFQPDADGEGAEIDSTPESMEALRHGAELCGLQIEALRRAMLVKTMEMRGELFTMKLRPGPAADARDALAKALYGRLFDWIVQMINTSIQCERREIKADISVLDIFGFECFKNNSFEQLCINYTNETLQQQFNQFVFKMEQEEYSRENIQWSFIEFPDNQDCLDLVEHRTNGIFAILDDECRLPKGSDDKFAARLYKALEDHPRFFADVKQRRDHRFCVNHYAGRVEYNTSTFMDKNKDQLPKEASTLFGSATFDLVRRVFSDAVSEMASRKQPGLRSVGLQFKDSLHQLMEKIYSNKPHYIRCLKPNDENSAEQFWRVRVCEQLRYGGVLEAVRVARSGFPVRLAHNQFYSTYRMLANPYSPHTKTLPKAVSTKSQAIEMCRRLLQALMDTSNVPSGRKGREITLWIQGTIEEEMIQLGVSKVFLRKRAHDVLEARKSKRYTVATVRAQAMVRCFVLHKAYLEKRFAALALQRYTRGMLGRQRANRIRRQKASIVVQRYVRGFIAHSMYRNLRRAVIAIQSRYRGHKGRLLAHELKRKVKALILQKYIRRFTAFNVYKKIRAAVLALQCAARARQAKRFLKRLKVEAKDVGRLQQSNEALKAEIEMLKRKAEQATLEAAERLRQEQEKEKELMLEQMRMEQVRIFCVRVRIY